MAENGSVLSPYRRGWRAPWRRQWGTFGDGHSKLSYLARRIEREELGDYLADTAERARLRRQAARYLALIEMVTQSIGHDPKATVRRLTALQMTADRQLARLEAIGARRPQAGHESLADMVSALHREAADGRLPPSRHPRRLLLPTPCPWSSPIPTHLQAAVHSKWAMLDSTGSGDERPRQVPAAHPGASEGDERELPRLLLNARDSPLPMASGRLRHRVPT